MIIPVGACIGVADIFGYITRNRGESPRTQFWEKSLFEHLAFNVNIK